MPCTSVPKRAVAANPWQQSQALITPRPAHSPCCHAASGRWLQGLPRALQAQRRLVRRGGTVPYRPACVCVGLHPCIEPPPAADGRMLKCRRLWLSLPPLFTCFLASAALPRPLVPQLLQGVHLRCQPGGPAVRCGVQRRPPPPSHAARLSQTNGPAMHNATASLTMVQAKQPVQLQTL